MQSKPLTSASSSRTFVLVFETGDDVADGLLQFARENELSAARFTAIGAAQRATIAFYDLDEQEYQEIPVEEQTEVLSLTGNVTRYEGEPRLHAHVVLGRRDGSTLGGHLVDATVRPTLEVMLTEEPATLQREMDEASGLPLLRL